MKTNLTRYEINICFYADHELTQLELEALQLQISAQIEEPGEDSNYNANVWHYNIKSDDVYSPRRSHTYNVEEDINYPARFDRRS
jgi:hypothetical protein